MAGGASDPPGDPETAILHASSVSVGSRGLLILGRAGAGKSALALRMMALGAGLVADDRTLLERRADAVLLSAPAAIAGLIEARGLGILRAAHAPARLHAVLDLDRPETDRLPPPRHREVLGLRFPLLLAVDAPHFAAALVQFLKAGREKPE